MKSFDYAKMPMVLLTPDIVAILTSIHEHKGSIKVDKNCCYSYYIIVSTGNMIPK